MSMWVCRGLQRACCKSIDERCFDDTCASGAILRYQMCAIWRVIYRRGERRQAQRECD